MQIIKKDIKHGEIALKITEQEDLWHLSHIIGKNDIIKGKTERKIKVGNDENAKVVRKQVYIVLEAEKTEYAHHPRLRRPQHLLRERVEQSECRV